MYKFYFIILISFINKNSFSQNEVSPTKAKQALTSNLINKVIIIDGQSFDYRQLRHYGEESLQNMNAIKRKQIHFLYTESYNIININNCNDFKDTDFDIAQYEIYRKEDSDSIIQYKTQSGCILQIKLIARETISKHMSEIKN